MTTIYLFAKKVLVCSDNSKQIPRHEQQFETSLNTLFKCVAPENIHTILTEGIGFSRGGGGSSCLISQWGGGCTKGNVSRGFLSHVRECITKKQHKISHDNVFAKDKD